MVIEDWNRENCSQKNRNSAYQKYRAFENDVKNYSPIYFKHKLYFNRNKLLLFVHVIIVGEEKLQK